MIPLRTSRLPRTAGRARGPRAVLVALLAGLLASCGAPPPTPLVETAGYLAPLGVDLAALDLRPLAERHILLDPGHGGHFRGAVGRDGLTEAEVNLGVALHLRGLLEWAGARVSMTRTADTDFLSPADSSLASDLARRVALRDSLAPDAFLSLHHNSNAALDRALNETQTYHPLDDAGASRDLARALHRRLALHLGIRPARLLPGNFRVLRDSPVPAALGEPAMISHPQIEQRLGIAASQRLEAESYFLGLLDFFAAGAPVWRTDAPETLATADLLGGGIAWTFDAGPAGSPAADPSTFVVTVDGSPVAGRIGADGRTLRWRPDRSDLPRRAFTVAAAGRNTDGRAARAAPRHVRPARRPRIELAVVDGDSSRAWRWQTTPAADGRAPRGRLVWPDGRSVPVGPDHPDWVVTPRGDAAATGAPDFVPEGGPRQPTDLVMRSLPAGWDWLVIGGGPRNGGPRWSPRVLPGADAPPAGQGRHPLVPVHGDRALWWEAPGFVPLVDPAPGRPGARTVDAARGGSGASPILAGLADLVVVLDPAGGAGDPDGVGPLGLRGDALNLDTAVMAARLLAGYGAEVHLTRDTARAPAPAAKVRLANRVGADLFISIGRSSLPGHSEIRHHPGSDAGEAAARALAGALAGWTAGADSVTVAPGWEYLLRHTACPAVAAYLPCAGTAARDVVLSDLDWARLEARAVAAAVTRVFAAQTGATHVLDPGRIIDRLAGDSAGVDLVLVDGQLPWRPAPSLPAATGPGDDRSLVSGTDPGLRVGDGPHTLEIRSGRRWQLWLIGSRGADPRLLLEGE